MVRSIRFLLVVLVALGLTSCASKAPSHEQAIAEAIASLNVSNPAPQVPALLQLCDYGAEAQSATPMVLELLKGKDKNVRRHAALALSRTAPPDQAVPALNAALSDPDPDVRRQAAIGLGEFGSAAASALPELERFNKEQPDRCANVATAINNIRR